MYASKTLDTGYLPVAMANQKEWLYSGSKDSVPIEKLHCGMLYIVEKEAKEKKIKAAVATIMKPA